MRPHRAFRAEAPLTDETWEAAFERRLRGGDVLGASDVLRNTGTDGWVRKAEHDRAAAIVDGIAPAPIIRRDRASRLLAHPRRVDRELAARSFCRSRGRTRGTSSARSSACATTPTRPCGAR